VAAKGKQGQLAFAKGPSLGKPKLLLLGMNQNWKVPGLSIIQDIEDLPSNGS